MSNNNISNIYANNNNTNKKDTGINKDSVLEATEGRRRPTLRN